MRLIVINGPNLNMLGRREPETYGSDSLQHLERVWRRHGSTIGIGVDTYQSNHEGDLIDRIQDAGDRYDGIVINPGAYSHYSYAIHDAIVAIDAPVVEVHISNIHEREAWRAESVTSPATIHTIFGRGTRGYLDAIDHLWARNTAPAEVIPYGSERDQFVEIRRAPDARGTVSLLHGGFWRPIWERDLMDRLAVALTHSGWTTANVEYRRGAGSFATADGDITAAHAAISEVVPGPITAVGHSAGGYLAIRSQTAETVTGAVGLAPVTDLEGISHMRPDDDPVTAFIGATATEDPHGWKRAALDDTFAASTVVIHGTDDDAVPVDHSVAKSAALRYELVVLEEVDHMSLIDPDADAYETLVASIERLAAPT